MADTKKRITDYTEETTLQSNDYVLIDNGNAGGTRKFLASNLGGSSASIEVIMGDLDRSYGTTTSNYIGTFNSWVDIDSGYSFSDYDEILLVCKRQNSSITNAIAIQVHSTNVKLLEHYNKVSEYYYADSSSVYVKYGLDYTNDKFYLENFNYLCPIALIGVKY